MHDPAIATLVPGPAAMQDTTIVPHHQITRTPAMGVDQLRRRRSIEQVAKERARVVGRHADDLAGVRRDEERLAPVDRVGANQRLRYRRHLRGVLRGQEALADQAAGVLEAVDGDLALQHPPGGVGQPRVRHSHAGELGLTALGRDLASREQRRVRGHALEGAVGVPHLIAGVEKVAPVAARDQPVLAVDICQVGNLRAVARMRDHRPDRRLELPEPAAECDLRLVVEPLTPEEEHRVLLEGIDDARKDAGVESADVDADDLGAQERMQRSRLERRHFLSLRSSYGAEYGCSAMSPSPDASTRGPTPFRKPSSQSGAAMTRSWASFWI